jgi:hypothetical protein
MIITKKSKQYSRRAKSFPTTKGKMGIEHVEMIIQNTWSFLFIPIARTEKIIKSTLA